MKIEVTYEQIGIMREAMINFARHLAETMTLDGDPLESDIEEYGQCCDMVRTLDEWMRC